MPRKLSSHRRIRQRPGRTQRDLDSWAEDLAEDAVWRDPAVDA